MNEDSSKGEKSPQSSRVMAEVPTKELKLRADLGTQQDVEPSYFYNLVFSHKEPGRDAKTSFCSVRLDKPIAYGSDLESLRSFFDSHLKLKEFVIISWRLMDGPKRPDGSAPQVLHYFEKESAS